MLKLKSNMAGGWVRRTGSDKNKNIPHSRSFRGNDLERRLRRVVQIKDFGFGSKFMGNQWLIVP